MSVARLFAQEAARDAPPEELVQLRRQFEARALTTGKLLSEQYANALSTIIRESAGEGDYDQALAAQRRRVQLVSLYSKAGDDTTLTNVILLKPGDARVNGAVNYDRNQNTLVGWKTVGSIASWDVTRVTPGTYDVTLTYAVAEIGEPGRTNTFATPADLSTGGEFEFYEDSSLSGAEQNHRTAQVTSTGGWTNWTSLTLPPLKLTRTSARLALRITKARGTGGVMNLQGIRLSPASANAAAASGQRQAEEGASAPADEFASVQQAYVEHLRQAITPVVNSYTGTLRGMAAKPGADPEIAKDYDAESKRAAHLLEEPESVVSASPKGPGREGNAEGFREMRGATYVASALNTGDRFQVKQGTDEFWVRLLWISCAPVDPNDTKLRDEFARYFGISGEDALSLGQQARDFTSVYLSGKALTLLTRGTTDHGDDLLATIRPDAVGDFAGVLVDRGLAMIKAPAARKGPSRTHEEAVLQDLKLREDAAKTKPVPLGAWARRNADE